MVSGASLFGLTAFASLVLATTRLPDLGTVLSNNKDLTTYYQLIQKYPDILLQLPNYNGVTIVAPSNEAFKNVPYTALNGIWDPNNKTTTVPLLEYHILQGTVNTASLEVGPTYVRPSLLTDPQYTNVTNGQNVEINVQPDGSVVFTTSTGTRCTATQTDIQFQGGLVQVVDNLLIPPARLNVTAQAFNVEDFVGALYAAKLMPGLSFEQNITVFAPINKAIDQVGGSLDKLDAAALSRVMGYHVIPGQVLVSSSLTNGSRLQTLAKGASGGVASVVIRQAGNNKYVNSAQIVQPDILLANGILHLISDVLNPDAPAVPNPTAATQAPVYAITTVQNAFTSALPCTTNCPITTSAMNTSTVANATSTMFTSSSKGGAYQARATGPVMAGAALGMIGVGAGMIFV